MEGKEERGEEWGLRNTLDEKEKMRGLDEAGVFAKLVCSMVLLIALLWYIASFKGIFFS